MRSFFCENLHFKKNLKTVLRQGAKPSTSISLTILKSANYLRGTLNLTLDKRLFLNMAYFKAFYFKLVSCKLFITNSHMSYLPIYS